MSCRALGPSQQQQQHQLVSPEQYNALLERLDSEIHTRARLEAELLAARDQLHHLHRRLNSSTSDRSMDTTPVDHVHDHVHDNVHDHQHRYQSQTQTPPATVVHQRRPPAEDPPPPFPPTHLAEKEDPSSSRTTTQDKEILSHCSDISACKSAVRTPDTLKKSTQRKSATNLAAMAGVSKKVKAKKERTPKVKIPGQSRYWTPEEHKLFLEALNKYGHKDLRSISGYVGTRNMTQVRTHSQKYFMRLMREAKRQNPVGATGSKSGNSSADEASNEVQATSVVGRTSGPESSQNNNNGSEKVGLEASVVKEGDKYSVPNTCGMTLLCLVGQDTLPV